MKVILLGTGCGNRIYDERGDGRMRASALFNYNNKNVIINITPDILEQKGMFSGPIDAILVSHGHYDAIAGIAQLTKIKGQTFPIKLFASSTGIRNIKDKFKELEHIELIEVSGPFDLFGKTWTPIPFQHSREGLFDPMLGFKIDNIVYSEDVESVPKVEEERLKNLDLWILDGATYGKEIIGHLEAHQTVDLAAKMGAKSLIITQRGITWPPYEKASNEIQEYAKGAAPDMRVKLGYDGMAITDTKLEMWANQSIMGLYLVPPHGQLIYDRKKVLIVKSKLFKNIIGQLLYVVEDSLCYGIIKLISAEQITLDEFNQLISEHRISDEERRKWWGGKEILYAYEFKVIELFKEPRRVEVDMGTQTFIKEVKFLVDEEMIKDALKYDAKSTDTKVLIDDWRIVCAWYSTIMSRHEFKYTREEVIELAKKIYIELKSRGINFYPADMKKYPQELYKIVSGEEIASEVSKDGFDLESKELYNFFKNNLIIKDFISIVGSVAKPRPGHKPNDLDIHIRMSEPTDYIKRAVQVRILKSLPASLVGKIHFIWGDAEGSHDTFIPLYDLELKRILPLRKVEMMDLSSNFMPGKKFMPPKTTKETLTTPEQLKEYFANKMGKWAVEEKLDGFRCVIHKSGDEVHLYTDKLTDITSVFPTLVSQIRDIKKDLIIDCELIPYDSNWKPLDRTDLLKFIGAIESGKETDDSHIRAHVFDLIYYGKDIISEPWNERNKLLRTIQFKDNFKVVPSLIVDDITELVKASKFVASFPKSEGAMIKAFDSKYPSGETTGDWIKYKPLSQINVEILKVNQAGDVWNYTVGVKADSNKLDPDYVQGGILVLGNTFNTKQKFDVGDKIVIEVEEVWRHINKDNKYRYSIHKPHVTGPSISVDGIDRLDRLVVSKGVEVKENAQLPREEPKTEPGTRGEAAEAYWKKHWQDTYPKDGKGQFVYQHHWRGLTEEEAGKSEDELFKTNNSVHGDIRMETNSNSLFGYTMFLGSAAENTPRDRVIRVAEDKGDEKIQGAWKLEIPYEWLDVGKKEPLVSPPGGVGSTSDKYAKLWAEDWGEYEMGTWREHSIELFFNGKKIKGRAIFQYAPVSGNEADRIWLVTFPKDQTPYMDSHNIDEVKKELKSKGQKWLILAKPGMKPERVEIE